MNREEYEKDLKRRQEEHLKNVRQLAVSKMTEYWTPCMHDQCTSCHGTGIKLDGSMCLHAIICPCPKCSVYC